MKGKRVAITTLGCKVNQYESAVIAESFQERGCRLVEFTDVADFYIINTCSVTHIGDRKSRQMIRRAVRINPKAIVAVIGCYAQISPDEVLAVPGVDLVVGTQNRNKLVELVAMAKKDNLPVKAVSSLTDDCKFEDDATPPLLERARALLKIQDGCNNYCTYCIVPYARGPLRSQPPEQVIDIARKLVADGYKEIVLTGIHTGSYGQDLSGGLTLAGLLRDLVKIPDIARIRLSSIEPNDITLELVDVLSDSPIFCKHLHVPLQSGDDGILKKMGRRYTPWEYLRLISVLKESIPGVGLTTDVIVGFPGETAESFERTYNVIKKCSFSKLHVFKYSPRPGTPAASFNGQIPPDVKEERIHKLIKLNEVLAANFAISLIGQVREVLVEGQSPTKVGMYEGFTDNYMRVVFPASVESIGLILRILIEEVDGLVLKGRII